MKYNCTEDRFLKYVADHVINIIRDDGTDRHIRFRKPGTICYGFDLITWPDHLCISGDCGTYVFRRIEDMFGFFRYTEEYKKHYPNRKLFINRGYWEEKVLAMDKNGKIKEFSRDVFNSNVTEWFRNWCHDYPEKRQDFKEIWRELKERVMSPENPYDGHNSAMDFDHLGFRMQDFWECDNEEYNFSFEWCLYAIVWGISLYDKQKMEVTV